MAFSQAELDNIASAALDWHLDKGKVHAQHIQEKPLLRRLLSSKKSFASGKDYLTVRVKGATTTDIEGYTHNDQVSYANPANIKTGTYPWKEIHAGIEVTLTELKKDGISVTDSATGKSTSNHSGREMTALANLLDDKLDDMSEGWSAGMQRMFWEDGTQDANEVPGIKSLIVDTPSAVANVGGLAQGSLTWWRNRVNLAIAATVADAADQTLIRTLNTELRQLRRYGGRPTVAFCGSDFLDMLEAELRSKGQWTQDGWDKGAFEIGAPEAKLKGVMFEYDPTLDDKSEAKRCYMIDLKAIYPLVMEGEDNKQHSPARPHDQYVIYRAMTWTGGLVCKRRNSSGVYAIA